MCWFCRITCVFTSWYCIFIHEHSMPFHLFRDWISFNNALWFRRYKAFAPLDTVIRLYSLRSYCEQSWFINFPFRWLMARLQKHNWSLCTDLTLSNLFEFIRSHSFPVYFVDFLYIGLCHLQTDIICTFLFNCDAFIPFSRLIALVSAMLTWSGECRLPCCSPDLG